jgi:hypothetical protein
LRRPWPNSPYTRPNHYRESVDEQRVRHLKEMAELEFEHSIRMGKMALRDLETSLMQGNVFDEVTAGIILRGKLRTDGVKSEHLDAVVATFLPQYLAKVGGKGSYGID